MLQNPIASFNDFSWQKLTSSFILLMSSESILCLTRSRTVDSCFAPKTFHFGKVQSKQNIINRVLQCMWMLCVQIHSKICCYFNTLWTLNICDQNLTETISQNSRQKSPAPPPAGIDQLIPPPRPLGLRSANSVVKDVSVDDLDLGGGEVFDLGGGEVRVEVFSVDGGRRLLPTPRSVEISDLVEICSIKWKMGASKTPFLSCWRRPCSIPSHLVAH